MQSDELPAAEDALRRWVVPRGWEGSVERIVTALTTDGRDTFAWAEFAMMLGDTGAADLCMMVCLHARALDPSDKDDDRIRSHMGLAAWDLGLARREEPAQELISNEQAMAQWMRREVSPFWEGFEAAAHFILGLAAMKVGLVNEPSRTHGPVGDTTGFTNHLGRGGVAEARSVKLTDVIPSAPAQLGPTVPCDTKSMPITRSQVLARLHRSKRGRAFDHELGDPIPEAKVRDIEQAHGLRRTDTFFRIKGAQRGRTSSLKWRRANDSRSW